MNEVDGDTEATAALVFALTGLAAGSAGILAQLTSDDFATADRATKNEYIRGCTAIIAEEFARRGTVG